MEFHLYALYLLSNLAQKEKLPRQILRKITTVANIGTMLKLFNTVKDDEFQIQSLKFFENLIINDTPTELFDES